MTKPDRNLKATGARVDLPPAPLPPTLPPLSIAASAGPATRHRDHYLNRELSWLEFNKRVLNQADDRRTPLLERVRFLAIADNNIDDFYMKRIGGLKQQIGAGITSPGVDGRTPACQIADCNREVRAFQDRAAGIRERVLAELAGRGIRVRAYRDLTQGGKTALNRVFRRRIQPLLTPLPVDADHPLPFISNLSLNLLVQLDRPGGMKPVLARIKLPDRKVVPRFVRIGETRDYVLIEDIIVNNLGALFPTMKLRRSGLFRVTRNAISDMDTTGAGDLLEVIETRLRTRKFAPVVRLQTSPGISPSIRRGLAAKLGLDETGDVFENQTMLGLGDLAELATAGLPDLLYPPHRPVDNPALPAHRTIFQNIRRAGSILVMHPYESFVSSVGRLVKEASTDPRVLSIKMTLYRTSSDTGIIDCLAAAALAGKQVAVVVELQARNDEAANIEWAARLEAAGVHVNHGVLGLKTHCKTILVVRQEADGLQRYAHFGTGNYHAGTARAYSDVGLLTCDEDLVNDLSELFNYLTTRWSSQRDYARMLVAPRAIKSALLARIDREITLHRADSPGLIRLKTNALEDVDIVAALYRASQAGVKVELLVRDICRLRPGVRGLSENIAVVSIVGRFLEHSRIYYFRNGGDEEFFIGSADLMQRNLRRRVEVIIPVRDRAACASLHDMLLAQLADQRSAWDMHGDGRYTQRHPTGGNPGVTCQELAIQAADRRRSGVTPLTPAGSVANTNIAARMTQSTPEAENVKR